MFRFRFSLVACLLMAAMPYLHATSYPGSLPGEVMVDNRGSANYSIPIDVVPGAGGFQPQLSLNYSSIARNGYLGVGWNLGGMSAISRIPSNHFQKNGDPLAEDNYDHKDFVNYPVEFSHNDLFALDGSRLIVVSGNYGLSDSEYRTEVDQFAKIVANSQAGTGPASFTLKSKDGLTMTYGGDSNSRLMGTGGSVYQWLLSEVTDSVGNTYRIIYNDSLDEKYPTEISYGANWAYKVILVYEESNPEDKMVAYMGGTSLKRTVRLSEIQIKEGDHLVRSYDLDYGSYYNTGLSRLESVQLFSGGDSIPSTKFEWAGSSTAYSFYGQKPSSPTGNKGYEMGPWYSYDDIQTPFRHARYGVVTRRSKKEKAAMWTLDIDGDGVLEVMRGYVTDSSNNTYLRRLWAYDHDLEDYATKAAFDGVANVHEWETTEEPRLTNTYFGDMNGDGCSDMIIQTLIPIDGKDVSNLVSGSSDTFEFQESIDIYYSKKYVEGTKEVWKFDLSSPISLPLTTYQNSDETQLWIENPTDTKYDDSEFPMLRIHDMNGDGISDIVRLLERPETTDPKIPAGRDAEDPDRIYYQIYITGKTGFHDQSNGAGVFAKYLYAANSVENRRILFGDANGDQMMDLAIMSEQPVDRAIADVFYSTGTDYDTSTGAIDRVELGDWNQDHGVQFLEDVNGDGMQDLVYADSGKLNVFLSTGDGFTSDVCNFQDSQWNETVRPFMGDMNGDGKSDYFCIENSKGNDTPSEWDEGRDRIRFFYAVGDSPDNFFSGLRAILVTPVVDVSGDAEYLMADMNSDGMMDVVRTDKTGDGHSSKMVIMHWIREGDNRTFVDKVTNGLGHETRISYNRLTEDTPLIWGQEDSRVYKRVLSGSEDRDEENLGYPYLNLFTPYYVVSSVGKQAGFKNDENIEQYYTTFYQYAEAYAHLWGRGFLGFRSFTSRDVRKHVVKEQRLKIRFPYTGMIKKSWSDQYDEDDWSTRSPLSNVVNEFELSSPNPTTKSTYFPYVSNSTDQTYELGQSAVLAKTVTTNAFDAYGNNTDIKVEVYEGNTLYSDVVTTNIYDNLTEKWYLGRLSSATVTSRVNIGEVNEDTKTKKSEFTYYDQTTGLLYQEIIEPDNSSLSLTTTYSYDGFGNIQTKSISGNDPLKNEAITRTTNFTYDDSGRYLERTTNGYSQHTENEYGKIGFGLPTGVYGVNRLKTSTEYDEFGRVTKVTAPDDTEAITSYEFVEDNDGDAPDDASYLAKTSASNNGVALGYESKVYYDVLGREMRGVGYNGDGEKIFKDTRYDVFGRPEEVTEPYFDGTSAENIYSTITTFDIKDRPLMVTQEVPASRGSSIVTEFIYNGFETTEIRNKVVGGTENSDNQTTVTLKNARGKIKSVTDNNSKTMTYVYDAAGNLTDTIDSEANVVHMNYDIRGFKISMTDPDMGEWFYTHNALGELRQQTDAKGNVTLMFYDRLGRMVRREIKNPEDSATEVSVWGYNNDPTPTARSGRAKRGKLVSETGPNGHYRLFTYDEEGRLEITTESIAGKTYTSVTDYDNHGRVGSITYPGGRGVINRYDSHSVVEQVEDFISGSTGGGHIWFSGVGSHSDYDQYGRLVEYRYGHNNLKTDLEYEDVTGYLSHIRSGIHTEDFGGGVVNQSILSYSYTYDNVGNITSRTDHRENRVQSETFGYDDLNRLTHVNSAETVRYDAIGNIIWKDGVGTYSYDSSRPHAMTATSGNGKVYQYDANGNITQRGGSSIWWTAFNKTRSIFADNGAGYTYYYDANHQRVLETVMAGEKSWSKFYVGSLYEEEHKDGKIEKRHFIPTPAGVIGVWSSSTDPHTPDSRDYRVNDHLGSASVIVGEGGDIRDEYSYDSWGNPRSVTNWSVGLSNWPSYLANRGFTGHEMLEEIELIHMNARIYDPVLGKFLSPDTYIQFEHNLQSYNRYSYVINNPLRYTDPSGNFIDAILLISSAYFVVDSAIQAYKYEGSIGAFKVIAGYAMSIGVGGYVGDIFGHGALKAGELLRKSLVHGLTQGAIAEFQGGSFASGFASAFASSLGSGMVQQTKWGENFFGTPESNPEKLFRRTMAAAVIGGTASELAGGKFSNGAVTAAFVHLFNDERVGSQKGEFDTSLSKDVREKLTKLRLMTIDEAEKFIAEHDYGHTGIVFNKSDETIYAMLEGSSDVMIAVPENHAVLGVDTVFSPSAYKNNGNNWIQLKVVGGAEITYSHAPVYRTRRGSRYTSDRGWSWRDVHSLSARADYMLGLGSVGGTGWTSKNHWDGFQRMLRAEGLIE